ncbi:MAG: hemolysin family protein [Planctomycetota bacterium]|jgi:CBS domain containing-hemolysin-like protein
MAVLGSTVAMASVFAREAVTAFSFSDVEEFLRKRHQAEINAASLERLANRMGALRFMLRLMDYSARFVVVVAVWQLTATLPPLAQVAMSALIIAVLLLVLDAVVRPLGDIFAEPVIMALLRPLSVLYHLLWLPTWPYRTLHGLIEGYGRRGDGEGDQADDDILAAVSLGEYTKQIDEQQREMIESVLGLDDQTVDSLMTPRTEMHAVPAEDGVAGVLEVAKRSGHSRLPVYEGNRDNIIGVCYVKDLIDLDSADLPPLSDVIRPPLLVPESKCVSELLGEFRRERIHLAIVIDEYGGTAGLISIEDIIEEVFGDIADEYDQVEDAEVRALGATTLELDARLHVDEVNDRFAVNLPEGDHYESIGGLVISRLGMIPKIGATWQDERHQLTVLEATDRRVVRLRLERLGGDTPTA